MVPMRGRRTVEASHEPGSAGILADTASDLAGRDAGAPRFMASEQVRKEQGTFHEPKGRASSPLRADECNHASLLGKGRRARSDAPYLGQLVHGTDARPMLEVEAF